MLATSAPVGRRPRPAVVAPVPVAAAVVPAAGSLARPAQPRAYVVAPGETLYALARRQGVPPAELAAWNNLPLGTGLRAGQVLRLGPPEAVATPSVAAAGYHTVVAGDTFFSISRRYRCTVAELQAHNERPDLALHPGEVLRVPRY
ncbi:MAG: LysM peptidoglycan-binding domain-containing protein [Hymenobacter sp.]|nr:MAG: LysM peptidoglycan-binding domain-containing protein [Hymenobacter sp.]